MVLQAHQFISAFYIIPISARQAKLSKKLQRTTSYVCYYYITMDELLNPEKDERLVLYVHVCMIPVWYARGSIGGSAFDIAS